MSSTRQATSSASNFQLIVDALADYSKMTGIDLSTSPSATLLEQLNSPEAILQMFQERANPFKEYREGNRSLITCLSPAVKILHAFSGILGDAASPVSHIYHFSGFKVTLSGPLPACNSFVCWD